MKRYLRLGYIICQDNPDGAQKRWLTAYQKIFDHWGVVPHVISTPVEARPDYGYVWRPNHENFFGEYKNSEQLSHALSRLAREYERRGAVLLPASRDLGYYENKKKIFELARKYKIRIPQTEYVENEQEASEKLKKFEFPVLLKYPFSCNSFGMRQIKNRRETKTVLKEYFQEFETGILQEELKISRDLRVNFVGGQGICSYWRTKVSGNASSATRFGGQVDHFSVPAEGLKFAGQVANKLGLVSGGIDMAWANDDLTSDPYLLEVSPIFDPNPAPLRPSNNWRKFKQSRDGKQLTEQIHLEFAARQIDYLRVKVSRKGGGR